jgi:hypothetical protein
MEKPAPATILFIVVHRLRRPAGHETVASASRSTLVSYQGASNGVASYRPKMLDLQAWRLRPAMHLRSRFSKSGTIPQTLSLFALETVLVYNSRTQCAPQLRPCRAPRILFRPRCSRGLACCGRRRLLHRSLDRFSNCCTRQPFPSSGFFLKKEPPHRLPVRAWESKDRSTSASPTHTAKSKPGFL